MHMGSENGRVKSSALYFGNCFLHMHFVQKAVGPYKSASDIHVKIFVIWTDLPCVLFILFSIPQHYLTINTGTEKIEWAKRARPSVSIISSRTLEFRPVEEVLPLKIPLTYKNCIVINL
jgi:hypothetical protein